MTPCPKCGTLSDGMFCPKCGAQVVAQVTPTYQPQQSPPPIYPHQPQQPPFAPQQPYPGVQYTPAPPPRRGSSWWKWLLGIVGGLIGLFVLLMVVAVIYTDDTPAAKETPTSVVGVITITDKVNPDTQEPAAPALKTVPSATPQIYAAAPVTLKKGQKLSAQWFVNGAYDPELDGSVTADRDVAGVYASFYIKPAGKSFTPGTYKVILYVDGNAAEQAEFTVK